MRLPAPFAGVQAVLGAGLTAATVRPAPPEAQLQAVASAVVPSVLTTLILLALALALPLTLLARGGLTEGAALLREGS